MERTKELQLLGVSFRTAPAAVREALSFNREETASLLQAAADETPGLEVAVLSTCNRTEFYLASPADSGVAEGLLLRLRRSRPQAPILRSDCLRYQFTESDAARHLFQVASGLDSSILGDVQILGQVRQAMAMAAECDTLGSVLNRTFGQAVRAGKRARAETSISGGAASIGSALTGMISERYPVPPADRDLNILILGAGELAYDICRHVAKRSLGKVTVINRTYQRARDLALHCGADALHWSSLQTVLAKADIVIAATAAPKPIIPRETLERLAHQRPDRPLLAIDAGLPRNIESCSAIEVIDIDAIRELQEEVLQQRRAAVPAVESIVDEEVDTWDRWRASLPLEGIIKSLYHEVQAHSCEAAGNLIASASLTQAEAEQIVLKSIKQLLHPHVRRLRGSAFVREVQG